MSDKLKFKTEYTQVKKDWYEWRVWVDEPATVLDRIEEVEYVLHPTFSNRIRHIRNRETRFALESEGWGGFDILVTVRFKNDDESGQVVKLRLPND